MSTPKKLQLIPFRCPECLQPLSALAQDTIYFCANCRTGLTLRQNRILKTPILFHEPANKSRPVIYLPFWKFDGRILLYSRETQSAHRRTFIRRPPKPADVSSSPQKAVSSQPIDEFVGRFLIPAFETPEIIKIGTLFTTNRFEIRETSSSRLLGGTLTQEEAAQIADLVYISIEASRADLLKTIDFKLELTDATLIGLPFAGDDKSVVDLTLGYKWSREIFPSWPEILSFDEDNAQA